RCRGERRHFKEFCDSTKREGGARMRVATPGLSLACALLRAVDVIVLDQRTAAIGQRELTSAGRSLSTPSIERRRINSWAIMQAKELFFVIPTFRLRDVGRAVEEYDQQFWRNGHTIRIVVFDDSSPANQAKYLPQLEQVRTHNEVFYVGSREKEEFTAF